MNIITKNLISGGTCEINADHLTGPRIKITDSKGTIELAISTDGDGFPCIDIVTNANKELYVKRYDDDDVFVTLKG